MGFSKPQEIMEQTIATGVAKTKIPLLSLLVLGFLGGAFIALGFLLDIRVIGNLPAEWGSFGSFLGAAVFPLGLVLVVLAGAELITGNMMSVASALFSKRISLGQLLNNWFWVLLSNFVGALFVAYFFGHVVGLTETGPYLDKTVAIAGAKIDDTFLQTFVSAIGCNWLVCLAVWLAYGAHDFAGKILAIWFPVMAFVAIGFQHVVANMFVIPAAIFAGSFTWVDFIGNIIPAFLGNVVGGAVFVGLAYFVSYKPKNETKSQLKKAS
ncbi:formate/nitrite transporter family protein [Cytobacillus sp. FSL W7-1323]|uniref:Formate/nitrite transporter n=1 Tax=Cytobacillus kochii TaxID=859143 RepID=A0A248TM06_9BACI|nr:MULTISPECIES: formate/nitrite transporter family protein [Cytobacillus]ASV69258.1 formate/nitrite transporter [Cytobacillus kochii]MDQ0183994.1 formate/nitrite transporter [Cytobacillus kochii]MEA1852823.1 formate/nitrite transporter family protein [Cytobacillus sp. OWB-43]MED1604303.1 formate/nitrite transporter family protein [Cytobacillus kochii]